jgi:ElaB/YqjD/DUF883 family membrane-anchored ribosome-binding protein
MGEATNETRPRSGLSDTASEPSAVRHQDEDLAQDSPDATQIRSGIEQTRGNLTETLDALQDKLDPARITEQVKDKIREKATEAYDAAKSTVKEATIGRAEKIVSSVSETVSDVTGRAGRAVKDTGSSVFQYVCDHPVAFTLLGVGLGMLTLNRRKVEQPWYGSNRNRNDAWDRGEEDGLSLADSTQNVAGRVADSTRDVAGRASDAISSATDRVREAVGTMTDSTRKQLQDANSQARESVRAASGRFQNVLQENPMALGVAALAAGAIVGLSLPRTRLEGEYLGEARDRLVDQAKSAAHEAVEKVQHVASEAGNTIKQAAQKEGLMTGEPADVPA